MTNPRLTHFDILAAKKGFAEGRNVTSLLREQMGSETNTSEIIETAYDLQAGTYIQHVEDNKLHATLYAREVAGILDAHLASAKSLLDVGTGEMTTLSLIIPHLTAIPRRLLAFDISWSRIYKGLAYAERNIGGSFPRLTPFVADISRIPLPDKSVSVTTSNHALEPNGGRLAELLAELFRVTRETLLLFEPCYEKSSAEGMKRMDSLGYIKGLETAVGQLGGSVVATIPMRVVDNPLNPTFCFVVRPPATDGFSGPEESESPDMFSVPGTNHPLVKFDNFYVSKSTGLCFPILKTIPIFKSTAAILATALTD
jgi:SAM-dependent methyltransferase